MNCISVSSGPMTCHVEAIIMAHTEQIPLSLWWHAGSKLMVFIQPKIKFYMLRNEISCFYRFGICPVELCMMIYLHIYLPLFSFMHDGNDIYFSHPSYKLGRSESMRLYNLVHAIDPCWPRRAYTYNLQLSIYKDKHLCSFRT